MSTVSAFGSSSGPAKLRYQLLALLGCVVAGFLFGFVVWRGLSPSPQPEQNWLRALEAVGPYLLLCLAMFVGGQLAYRNGRRDEAAGKEWRRGYFLR